MSESREEFAARLRRTVRVSEQVPPDAGKSAAPLPKWYMRRMGRDTQRNHVRAAEAVAAEAHPSIGQVRTRGLPQRLKTESNARGSFGVRIEHLPIDHAHGDLRLGAVLRARGESLALLTGDASLAAFDARDATFLDIETSGLSGGAGTHVFQIGLLEFDGTQFQLWQGFLRSPDEAAALLQACADRVRRRGALVSFFGKSFDRHRLEDQMRLQHVEPPFEGRAHLDLYHPCRRLYGKNLANARLSTMERELCGVQRERDLPGAFAPAAWFDFLAGREHLLEAVFLHNRLDVLSLVGLCAHVSGVFDNASLAGSALARARALAEMFTGRRDWPRAIEWSERVLQDVGDDCLALACLGRALQRTGRFDEARGAFTLLATLAQDDLAAEALAELAQLAARERNFAAALAACEAAELRAASALTGARLARLSRKLASVRRRLARTSAKDRRAIDS